MKKINNKGFTLIELLTTITILAIVLSITLFFGVNIIKNAREKSYKVTKNNVEKAAVAYLKENNDITFVERNDVPEKTEYQCIKVKNLIDYGYFDTEILKSEYKQDEKVTPDQFIYVERNKTTKTITNSVFPATESFCEAIQDKNIIINYDKGWAKFKKVKITYKLSSVTSQNELKEFKYLYDINGTNQIDESFENRTISKSFNITENNSEIYAKIYNINNSDDSISKAAKISKIDNKKPYVESLPADNGKSETKNVLVTIVDKETKQNETKDASGFDANDKMLTVQYGWSLSDKEAPTEYKDAKISYKDCNEKNPTLECKTATFNAVYDEKVNGEFYLWIKPKMKDMAGNEVSEYVSEGTYKVTNSSTNTPIITRVDYNTFEYNIEDKTKNVTYYVSTNEEKPKGTESGWGPADKKDVTEETTYYVWTKDESGNISDPSSISSHTVKRIEGKGTTLKTKYDSTEENNGTEFNGEIIVLEGTPIFVKATMEAGYNNLTLKYGENFVSASGAVLTTTKSVTISSTATASTYKITLIDRSATKTLYYQYNTTKTINGVTCYYYTDETLTKCLDGGYYLGTDFPTPNTGYTFKGFFKEENGKGTQYVDSNKGFINNIYQTVGNQTLYSYWKDTTAPSPPTFIAKHQDDGTSYNGDWTNRRVVTTLTSTDEGSGISYMQYKLSDPALNDTWHTFEFGENALYNLPDTSIWTGTEGWEVTNGRNQSYVFRACDAVENCSGNSEVYTIKYDTTTPKVSLSAKKKTAGTTVVSGSWSNEELNFILTNEAVGASGATIYYCKDTTNTCNPTTKATSGATITTYNTTTGTYYIRYKIVGGSGNESDVSSYIANVDISKPSATLTITSTLKSTSQIVTLKCSDTNGVTGYYFGTSSTGGTYATTASELTSLTESSGLTKTVTEAGIYYLYCKDTAGNVNASDTSTTKTIYNYTVNDMRDKLTGIQGTYNTTNYEQISTNTYIAPKGTSLTLSSIYTSPGILNTEVTFAGVSTGAASTTAVTPKTTVPTLDANSTYAMWFNRKNYTVTLTAGNGISAVSGGGSKKWGASVSIDATVTSGYTWNNWTGYNTQTTKAYTFTMPAQNVSYTANASGSSKTATFYYYNGSSVTSTTASCVGVTSCNVTIPDAVRNSTGKYSGVYAGLASTTNTMTEAISSTATTVSLSENATYYSIYRKNVTNFYYGSSYTSRTLYRNEWLSSTSAISTPVLSTSATGTSNYSTAVGPGSSEWVGLATSSTTTPEYTTVSAAAQSTATTLYTIYQFNVTYVKGANVSTIEETNGICKVTTSKTSCTVTLPTITANTGYTSAGWSSTSGATTGTAAGSSYTLSKNNQTLYANAKPSELIFNNQTLNSGTYSKSYNGSFIGASNGTGSYSYTIANVTLDGATVTESSGKYNGIGLSSTTITGTPSTAGTYKFVIKATDNGSGVTKSATMTISIEKEANPITVIANTLTYNKASQALVTVSGAQGNVCYSTTTTLSSCSAPGTIPSETNAGNYTVYWYVAGNTNYNAKSGKITVTIDRYDLSNATIKDVEQKEYEYNTVYRPEPTVTVPLSGTTSLAKGTDFNYGYSNYDKIGTATITVTAIDGGNYKGTKSSTFTIADTIKPVCVFSNWLSSEIQLQEPTTINLTCTDGGSGIPETNLSSTSFEYANPNWKGKIDFSSIVTRGTETERIYEISVTGKEAGSLMLKLIEGAIKDNAGNTNDETVTAGTIKVNEPLSCTISYEKSSNKILRVQSGRTDVSIRAGSSTSSTRLALVDGGAEFPFISTEGTTGCSGGWKKILYNKTTEAYICGTYTEELDYSTEEVADDYYRIIDLKINASSTEGITYSFDGQTFSESNTLPTITSGTHTAYIKNSNDEIKNCSAVVSEKKEYYSRKCNSTKYYYLQSYSCQGSSIITAQHSTKAICDAACATSQNSCGSSNFSCTCNSSCTCASWGAYSWGTTPVSSKACVTTLSNTRTTYKIQ